MRRREPHDETRDRFEVTIYYKSGNSHSFWAYEFTYHHENKVTWEFCDNHNKPLTIGLEGIESIYQTDYIEGKV